MPGAIDPAPPSAPRPCLPRWLRATWLGWLLGIPLVIGLALLGEVSGVGGSQGLVGFGMGAGVGLLQGRELGRYTTQGRQWFWATAVGMAIPFACYDLLIALEVDLQFALYPAAALGGLLAGVWQALILRRYGVRPWTWLAASVLGWTAAVGVGALVDVTQGPRGITGALLFLAAIGVGGVSLGLCTGLVLVRANFRHPR